MKMGRKFASRSASKNKCIGERCEQARTRFVDRLGAEDVQGRWSRRSLQCLFGFASAVSLQLGVLSPAAVAEDELADAIASGRSSVDAGCFANECRPQLEACFSDKRCVKGAVCTAKCAGDTLCVQGCSAKYGDRLLDDFFQCTLQDKKCLKFDLGGRAFKAGPDSLEDAPTPPAPIVEDFKPASLEGRWYKVLGWNPLYDCFDCQQNTFNKMADRDKLGVDVFFQIAIPDNAKNATSVDYKTKETTEELVFDPIGSPRTASTQGELFGVSFWENWYVIGENKEDEPEYKFIYYNGHTIQNSYEGAFVYARTPTVPDGVLKPFYSKAVEAGWEPSTFCRIRNQCFASERKGLAARSTGFLEDIQDLLEDPKVRGKWLVSQQEKIGCLKVP